ncbi:uncharacterized protein [Panulirus ornatus]|uniref:uncharacterized protein n=1 Tax=Panulirus ornatus TaxID=150431 RepID=UPI003A84C60F
MRVEAGVAVVTLLCVAGGVLCHAANITTTWSTFLHHYIQAYTYNTVCFFVPTNESAWRGWVWAVFPGVARQTSAFITVREDMSEAQLWGRTLMITPLWTEQHAEQLSQWLSQETVDHLRWLVVAQRNFSNLASLVYFPLLNQATLAVQEGEEVNVWEIYQIDEGWRQRVELVGWWRPGLSPPLLDLPPEDVVPRRTNLTGLHLRCLTLESQPSTFSQLKEDGTVQVLGWFADVWREMQRLSNFT